ncbi:hypothetical protein CIPAW_01G129400 [Carya illinoinensis]|uniref:Uncharacterized protein n=1 Tax=Carya illinoinensis TaxID=32201 RepID=A0A8T1RM32_CARIL|nr:hypothetical protein CIPAW_01G129400 [Carya illinoinensis]
MSGSYLLARRQSRFQIAALVVHSVCILKEHKHVDNRKSFSKKNEQAEKHQVRYRKGGMAKHAVMKKVSSYSTVDREPVNIHSTSLRRPTCLTLDKRVSSYCWLLVRVKEMVSL